MIRKSQWLLPAAVALLAAATLAFWFAADPQSARVKLRLPGADQAGDGTATAEQNPVLTGKVVVGPGKTSSLPGAWPQFRGPQRDAISSEIVRLSRDWNKDKPPKELWSVDLGEGYAGAAVRSGRVYLMDYDAEKKQDALRCLSLADGQEIWRFAYPNSVKRNHGMSRTVPSVVENRVVAIGPKCHVVCLDATSGDLKWGLDLVRQYGATVPPWYAGQCPLIDGTNVILAPGGRNALLLASELTTGKEVWRSTNSHGWKMTHSSIMAMEADGQRMYVYCADKGLTGVLAADGKVLWETPEWKISIATVPSPLILPGGRVFLSGGYNAGSLLLQIKRIGTQWKVETVFRLGPELFGATQHTPIYYQEHIYGVRADGKFVCLTMDGKIAWTSDAGTQFGLGSFIMADGIFLAMNDSGLLRAVEARPDKHHVLAQAQILKGRESWGPLSLAGGRLLARDFTRLVCLDLGEPKKD